MQNISMKGMLEAGVHFGHPTSRWNPKMGRYIFGERNGIHILDLQKTVKELKKAYSFLQDQSEKGAKFLFVGTKKQAREIIKTEAERAGASCVYEKWLGGTLTNYATIKKSIERLDELEKWENEGLFNAISKKEVSRLSKELARLRKVLGGIRHMGGLPTVMFVIDPTDDSGAIAEARKLGIPIVGVCDTNSDPDTVDYPIPGNDDAARSIKLFCSIIADAILDGRKEKAEPKTQEEIVAETQTAPVAAPVMPEVQDSVKTSEETAEEIKAVKNQPAEAIISEEASEETVESN